MKISVKQILGTFFFLIAFNISAQKYLKVHYLESSNGAQIPSYSPIVGEDWHYVALTKEGNVGKLYLDGNLLTSSTFEDNPYIWNSLILGATQSCVSCDPVPTFEGLIDDVRLSNTIRTATEINNTFISNSPLTADANTLGLFNFDSPSGTSMINSASSNDGILYGGVSYVTGKFGQAASFDGIDDYADFSESIPVDNVSLEFWFKSMDDNGSIAMFEYAYNTVIEIVDFPIAANCNDLVGDSLYSGLVGYWPFCGNANDESGNGNNGTVNGATLVNDRFGNPNSAYSFNGTSNYIEVPDSDSLKNLSEITISAWVNINDWYTSTGNYFPVLHKSNQTLHGKYALTLRDTGGFSHLDTQSYGIPYSPWNFNQWYHVVTIFANNNNKVYVNGILISDEPSGTFPNPYNSNYPLIIGMDTPGFLEYSNGIIDDIGIWNRALTNEEISGLYNSGICYQTITVTDTLIINVTTLSYDPITYLNTFTVYPNPASTQITIDNGDINSVSGYAVEIKNSLAQSLFYSEVNQQQFTVDISSWSTGLYFIYIYNDSGHLIDIRKIILQ